MHNVYLVRATGMGTLAPDFTPYEITRTIYVKALNMGRAWDVAESALSPMFVDSFTIEKIELMGPLYS